MVMVGSFCAVASVREESGLDSKVELMLFKKENLGWRDIEPILVK